MHRDALAAIALTVAATSCHRTANEEPKEPPQKVRCTPIIERAAGDVVEMRGTVQPLPNRDAQIAPQVSGRLTDVLVHEGDHVGLGQVVARVDAAPLLDALKSAEAAVARANADAENAETTLVRSKRVYERGIAPRQEVDDATARAAAAHAGEREADVARREARRQVDRATVKSPLAGVVLKVLRRPGELVDGTPATPVVEVADVTALELVSDVPASDLVRLSSGATADVVFPALPGKHLPGTVSLVSPSVDKTTGVGTVRVTLAAALLPPVGLYGVANVHTGGTHNAFFVPNGAVRTAVGGRGEVVVCGKDGKAHVEKVDLGASNEQDVAVTGVQSGNRVAIEPVLGLTDGEIIEAVP